MDRNFSKPLGLKTKGKSWSGVDTIRGLAKFFVRNMSLTIDSLSKFLLPSEFSSRNKGAVE